MLLQKPFLGREWYAETKAKAWQQNNKFAENAVIFELVQGLTSQQLFALVCKKLNNKVQIKRMNT